MNYILITQNKHNKLSYFTHSCMVEWCAELRSLLATSKVIIALVMLILPAPWTLPLGAWHEHTEVQ